MTAPILFRWNGEAMEPLQRFHNIVNEQFVVGQVYRLVEEAERSQRSHNHFFASVHDVWMNLPERLRVQFATDEHLRKHALIMSGYRDERSFACASNAEALRLARFLRPRDEYAIVSVHEATLVEWTAKSQSKRAMGGPLFQKSKQDCLDYLATIIGVEPEALPANARSVAA